MYSYYAPNFSLITNSRNSLYWNNSEILPYQIYYTNDIGSLLKFIVHFILYECTFLHFAF